MTQELLYSHFFTKTLKNCYFPFMLKLAIDKKQWSITQKLITDDDIKKVVSASLTLHYLLSGMVHPNFLLRTRDDCCNIGNND